MVDKQMHSLFVTCADKTSILDATDSHPTCATISPSHKKINHPSHSHLKITFGHFRLCSDAIDGVTRS